MAHGLGHQAQPHPGHLGLVVLVYLYYAYGQSLNVLVAVCVVLPLVLAASRAWGARRGLVELGLAPPPASRDVRPHLVQALNIWLCCALLGGVLAAGGTHYARIRFSLDVAQFNVVIAVFARGLVLLAALALVPRRRVSLATNVVVALCSGFLALQLATSPPHRARRSCSTRRWPASGSSKRRPQRPAERALPEREQRHRLRASRGERANPHRGQRRSADRLRRLRWPVLAPADGRIVEVTDGFADNPPGTNSDPANHLVIDIGGGRYVSDGPPQAGQRHGQRGRRRAPGPAARRGREQRPLQRTAPAPAGPGLPGGADADRTYPIVFRDVHITRGGAWPWGDSRESAPVTSYGRSNSERDSGTR